MGVKHFDTGEYYTACGNYVGAGSNRVTDVSKVTCKACKKTEKYKDACIHTRQYKVHFSVDRNAACSQVEYYNLSNRWHKTDDPTKVTCKNCKRSAEFKRAISKVQIPASPQNSVSVPGPLPPSTFTVTSPAEPEDPEPFDLMDALWDVCGDNYSHLIIHNIGTMLVISKPNDNRNAVLVHTVYDAHMETLILDSHRAEAELLRILKEREAEQ